MKSDAIKKGIERRLIGLYCTRGHHPGGMERPYVGSSILHEFIRPHTPAPVGRGGQARVYLAGGPFEVDTIGVCDGIAMGHVGMKFSLASRELIADSVETVAQAHAFDALVLIPSCDKIIPGMLMAAARLDLPTVVVTGGPMLAGRRGAQVLDLNSAFMAVGAATVGERTRTR